MFINVSLKNACNPYIQLPTVCVKPLFYSFDCIVNSEGEKINLIQHVWNVTNDHSCLINGLANGSTYRFEIFKPHICYIHIYIYHVCVVLAVKCKILLV